MGGVTMIERPPAPIAPRMPCHRSPRAFSLPEVRAMPEIAFDTQRLVSRRSARNSTGPAALPAPRRRQKVPINDT